MKQMLVGFPCREIQGGFMDDRRQELVAAARELYEENGLSRTTVKDISEYCGITRSLFYHYFPNKDAITLAVLDDYVADFTEGVKLWNENRVRHDVQGALRDCVKLMRRITFDSNHFRKMLVSFENASLYLEFLSRASDALSEYVVDTTVRDYEQFHTIEIDHVKETFFILIFGLVGYMRQNPDVEDETLMAIIAQTLRLEL